MFVQMNMVVSTVKNVLTALLATFLVIAGNAQRASQPNIIYILADDLGYGDVGCYGQKKIKTPNIDKLAKQGLKFNQFYSGSTVCAPARASFLTGLHTGHSAVRGNKGMKPEGQFPLPASAVTIASRLQENGYATAAFGKWSMGFITTSGDPEKKGFDEFYGYNCQTLAHNYFPDHLWHNHDRIELGGNKITDSVYSADLIHSKAMDFLSAKYDKPFFLYLPYTLPHADVVVPHDSVYYYYVKQFNEPPVQKPAATSDGEAHHYDEHPHAAFAAMVARLDSFVGQVVKQVEQSGLAGNTLILFTSDNGPHKEQGGDPGFFKSSGKFRGIKRDLYEGGIREPFIAYWKGTIKPGVTETPTAMWDLFPTFEELAGAKVSTNIDGKSIVPLLKTGKAKSNQQYFYWEFHESGGRQAVRWGDWKAVKLDVSTKADSPVELYNLKIDPSERNNVAAANRQVVTKMAAMMNEAHVPNPDWPFLYSEIKK